MKRVMLLAREAGVWSKRGQQLAEFPRETLLVGHHPLYQLTFPLRLVRWSPPPLPAHIPRWSPPPLPLPFPLRVGLHKSDSPTHLISSQFSKLSLHSPYPTIPTQGWFKPHLPACIPTQVFVHSTFPLDQMHMTSIINMFQSDFECIYCKSLTNKKGSTAIVK